MLEGAEAKLALRLVGYPQPEMKWFFNGRELTKSDYYDMTYDGEEACLYIRVAHPEHSGRYTCCLQNKFGRVEVTAQVSVAVKPRLTSALVDREVELGQQVRFSCNYEGFPPPDVTWYHNKLTLTVSALPGQTVTLMIIRLTEYLCVCSVSP